MPWLEGEAAGGDLPVDARPDPFRLVAEGDPCRLRPLPMIPRRLAHAPWGTPLCRIANDGLAPLAYAGYRKPCRYR